MNGDIMLLARLYKSNTEEAIEWIRNHPNDKSIAITSKVKKIYYGYGGKGTSSSEYDINIKSDGIYIRNGEEAETNKYTYSAIVRKLMELMDYMKSTGITRTYLDIFKEHYPNADVDTVKVEYCPGELFAGAIDGRYDKCTKTKCEECWNSVAVGEFNDNDVNIPEEWRVQPSEQVSEESELSDEEFNQAKAELEEAFSSVNEKKIACPHWHKGETLHNKGFGAVEFECAMHKESFFEGKKLTTFLATHCYNHIWCTYCDHPETKKTPKTNEPADDIECLELDIRTYNSLKQAGVNKVFEIREKADELSNAMGKKFNDVLLAVAKYNSKKDNDKTLSSLKKHLDDAIVPCPFWNAELCGIVGSRKKSIAFRCEALHSVDIYDFIDADRVISECCNYTECADYYRQQLKHITTPPNESWNMHTSIAELRRLCETYGSPDTIKNVVDSVMASDNAPVAVSAESTSVFDYTVLDDGIGDFLQKAEEQLKNEYMNFTANCGRIFAEAQERLAKHGFGENNGVFEKWIASMGFAKRTVYRMIQIYEFRSCQIGTNEGRSIFDALPKTLQADISAPSAPPELVEQVMSGDITTHKEYIELKKEFERVKEELESSKCEIAEINERAKYAESRLKSKSETISNLSEMNATLEKRVKELESRPIDVAAPDEEEIERMAAQMSRSLLNAKDAECDRRLQQMQEESRDKDAEISKLQQRIKENAEDVDMIRNTFMKLCVHARATFKACADFISNNNYSNATIAKLKCDAEGTIDTMLDIINDIRGVENEEDI